MAVVKHYSLADLMAWSHARIDKSGCVVLSVPRCDEVRASAAKDFSAKVSHCPEVETAETTVSYGDDRTTVRTRIVLKDGFSMPSIVG